MTMRKPGQALALVALTSLFLLGMGPIRCSPVSLEPIYTEKDLVFEPTLLGIWHESEHEAHVRITQSDDDMAYRILIVGGEFSSQATFGAHLVKLKHHLFLDLHADPDLLLSGWYAGSIVWAHQFLFVKQLRPTPIGVFMEDKWLTAYLRKHPRAISHIEPEKDDNFIILTAPTKKLHRFLRKAVKRGGFDHKSSDEIWKLTVSKATALHFVAAQGETDQVTRLIEQDAKTDARDEAGRTPLHWAAAHTESFAASAVIAALLDAGADVDVRDTDGRTPLMLAATHRLEVILELLASGADINAKDRVGETSLHIGAESGSAAVVELLLANRASVDAITEEGETPLHKAASRSATAVAGVLIRKGADVNARNKDGDTPLHMVARGSSQAMIKLLISKGARVNVKNAKGETPLALATNRDIVELLKRYGAEE
jgi:ankyrin repeat protein